MRILLSAYACEPDQGSEPGVGWRWALELARLGHEVTVLTQTKNRPVIEAALPGDGPRFIYYQPPPRLVRLKKHLPLQLYHLIWQYGAWRWLRATMDPGAVDVVHHITFCTLRQPSFLGRLPPPFVLGPVGGGERAPWRLRRGYGLRGHLVDTLRDLANLATRIDPITRGALARARAIYVSSEQTAALVPARLRGRVAVEMQIGIDVDDGPPPPLELPAAADSTLQLLHVGRLLHWKGLHLGLMALARLRARGVPARLTVVGAGRDEPRLRRLALRLGIEDAIDWIAWVPRAEVPALYRRHHALLFPSLHDSAGMVVLESLAEGLPVVCLDLGGPGRLVDRASGRVIATAGRDREACVEALADALAELAASPELRRALRDGARQRARAFRWPALVGRVAADIEARLARESSRG
jgi:glycosyltransferase involved in cell wall biosynthesis